MHDFDRTVLEDADEGFFETSPDEGESVFDEAEEMELASELLGVGDEQELEQFLGSLIKKAARAVGKVVHSPIGSSLVGMLKSAAKKALPTIGAALGTAFGGPAGGALGGTLASKAGQMFGLELEGLSPEDQEYEVARRVVRLAGQAAQHAAQAPRSAPPRAVAQNAIVKAAQQHAPGLVNAAMGGQHRHHRHRHHPNAGGPYYGPEGGGAVPSGVSGQSGRWVRRGRHIILYGV